MHFIELNLWRSLEILFIRCDTQIVSDISTEQYSHIGNEIFSREFSQPLKTSRVLYHFMKRNIFRLAYYLICNAFIIIRSYYQLSTIYKSLVKTQLADLYASLMTKSEFLGIGCFFVNYCIWIWINAPTIKKPSRIQKTLIITWIHLSLLVRNLYRLLRYLVV